MIEDPQPDLFDLAGARADRDKAIDTVEENREEWCERFEAAILAVAARQESFTSDDVLKAFPELEECEEKRVIGAAFRRLSGKFIEAKGYRESARRKSHARPKRVWKSMP